MQLDNDDTVPVEPVHVVAGIANIKVLAEKLGDGETRLFLARALKRAEVAAKALGGEIVGVAADHIIIMTYGRPAAERMVEAVREKLASIWVPRQVVAEYFARIDETLKSRAVGSLHARITYNAQVFLLDRSAPLFTVGRRQSARLNLNSQRVSRRHASLELVDGRIVLTDSSTNGTFVKFEGGGDVLTVHNGQQDIDRNAVVAFGNRVDEPTAERVTIQIFNRRG